MKESYLKEVQQFLDKGKTQDYAEIVACKRAAREPIVNRTRNTSEIKEKTIL